MYYIFVFCKKKLFDHFTHLTKFWSICLEFSSGEGASEPKTRFFDFFMNYAQNMNKPELKHV